MIRIIDEKDSGKTKKLLEACGKSNGVFVCKHPERVQDKCLAYGLPLVNAIGYNELLDLQSGDVKYNFYIDELEDFVNTIVPDLSGYCLSKED